MEIRSLKNVNKVSDLIAIFLKDKGITHLFGIIGGVNAHIFDSISRLGYTKIVCVHHEQAAVMAAGAYYKASGRIAVALVTAGAGASNSITGILSNWADSSACLVISGQEPTKHLTERFRMYGVQGFDFVDSVKKITKFAKTVTVSGETLEILENAYFECLNQRPGPVVVEFPLDIQQSKINAEQLSIFKSPSKKEDTDVSNIVINTIKESKRPVILGGNGIKISGSTSAFKKLVSKLRIPCLASWSSIDIFNTDNELFFGTPGVYGQRRANFIVNNCDLLIVMGSRLALPQTGYDIKKFAPNAKILMVNNDSGELDKYERYDIKINSDCGAVIENLSRKSIDFDFSDWLVECREIKAAFPLVEKCHKEDNLNFDNSYVLINDFSKMLSVNDIITIGQGSPLPCCHQVFEFKDGQIVLASNGLGEMGNGLPAAVGAAFSYPEKRVVLFDGDGSMMMNLQELETIAGNKLNIKIVIFNNEGYLFIKHSQNAFLDGRYTAVNKESGLTLPNFEKIAYGFGIPYFNTKNNSIEEFLNYDGCSIFECFMNPEQDLVPKIKTTNKNGTILHHPFYDMSPLLPIDIIEKFAYNIDDNSYKIRE